VVGTAVCAGQAVAAEKAEKKPAPVVTAPKADPVLLQVMDDELKRAMADLGSAPPAVDPKTHQPGQPAPRPYFLSYSVADSESVSVSAQYGAITSSNGNRQRMADVQVRLGSPALDNTHGDHRTSALTTIPPPLTDDRPAILRSL